MADCPGVAHLAAMADGGLARLRTPAGALTATQARAVADAAEALGSGVIDLTNRANLQIRGLAPDGGPGLSRMLEAAGFRFHGEADRRRNILLDPFSGLDPEEVRDLRPLAAALEERLARAPWIAGLSPKFSFALDGGGVSAVAATPSDVTLVAFPHGFLVAAGGGAATIGTEAGAVAGMIAIAEAACAVGPDARAADLGRSALDDALGGRVGPLEPAVRGPVVHRYGAVATSTPGRVAVSLPVPVGRLDPTMLRFLADEAEAEGEGTLALAPWSAVVVAGVREERAPAMLARSEQAGFTPLRVAERLQVVACSGAPACPRASEQAKRLGGELLALATAVPDRLPDQPRRVHLSACAKGCAGSAPADLLLLGASRGPGWTLHEHASPRAPGPSRGRMEAATAEDVLGLLRR